MKNKVRRIQPEFPKWETPNTGAGFIFGILLWLITFFVFLFMAYVALFNYNLQYFLQLIKPKVYIIPVWFSVLCVVFFFPVTLLVILLGTLVRIVKN